MKRSQELGCWQSVESWLYLLLLILRAKRKTTPSLQTAQVGDQVRITRHALGHNHNGRVIVWAMGASTPLS